ncbi:transcription factor bHLH18-like [Gastrolobium bilobum]|uniref:transcription factor bHLH18-like n=1 Tax=Gastrolobium bilobum TaxID=150636 RepID=UPI002AB30E07|nr:transcription factor bHLH18-like [Gastrolobium bilobum]
MEWPWHSLFSDEEIEDGDYFNHRHNNPVDDGESVLLQHSAFYSEIQSETTFDDHTGFLNNVKSSKLLTKSDISNSIASQNSKEKSATSPPSYILSFCDSTVVAATRDGAYGGKHPNREQTRSGRVSSLKGANQIKMKPRKSSESLDHIMAERKRRQELTQRFIALSAIIPGLKKIDKASILKETVTYVKQLQNRVKELEEQSSKKIVESISFINKANFYIEEGTASDDSHKFNVALPELEARVLEKEVLIRIHCEKNKGVLLKILTHIKNLDLSIVSTSVLPFGNFAHDVTIIAQMGEKYNVTVKDLVKSLGVALLEST